MSGFHHVPQFGNLPLAAEPMLPPAVIDRLSAEDRRASRILAAVSAISMVVIGPSLWYEIEHPGHKPKPPTFSCEGFGDDVLQPPHSRQFGLPTGGVTLNPSDISTAGMTARTDVQLKNGSKIKSRDAGSITRQGGKLVGNTDLTADYGNALIGLIQYDPVRWGICNLAGGVRLTATDTAAFVNGDYQPDKDATEFIFQAGPGDALYQDERDLYYVETHELGHALRNKILVGGTDAHAIELIKQLDNLYAQQVSMGVEEYRQAHWQDISADLDKLAVQFNAISDPAIAPASSKHDFNRAVQYLKQKLAEPDGFSQIAIRRIEDKDHPGVSQIAVLSLDEMLSDASQALDPQDPLYGLSEFFIGYPGLLDENLLDKHDFDLQKYLASVFISEHVLQGNSGGHLQDNSNETFASLFMLTQYVSPEDYDKVVVPVPERYRAISRKELDLMRQLRQTIKPSDIEQVKITQ